MQESVQGPEEEEGKGKGGGAYCDTALYGVVLFVSCLYLLYVGREGVVFVK